MLVCFSRKENFVTKTIPPENARQGRQGSQMLIVLICALLLVGIVWAGLEFYGESIDNANEAQTGQPATP